MTMETKGYEPKEAIEDSHEKLRDQFIAKAEEVLGDEYNAMEVEDIVSYFSVKDLRKWQSELSDLKAIIDTGDISPKEITSVKAKFIGKMIGYTTKREG